MALGSRQKEMVTAPPDGERWQGNGIQAKQLGMDAGYGVASVLCWAGTGAEDRRNSMCLVVRLV